MTGEVKGATNLENPSAMPHALKFPCDYPGCPGFAFRYGYCRKHAQGKEKQHNDDTAYYQSKEWRWLRAWQLAEEPDCRKCGKPGYTADHIIPRKQGGQDDISNLQTLCRSCDAKKRRTERGG